MKATQAWLELLTSVATYGTKSAPRGKEIRELLCVTSKIDMDYPIVTYPDRNLGYKFMAAESAWILSGKNDVETIAPFARHIAQFSDDGVYFNGAYGPKIVEQLSYICQTLAADRDSRQAVLNIWRERPGKSKDIPCTISVQWFIRDGRLECLDTMRSSDAWLGWPYDVFNFSMLSFVLRAILRDFYNIEVEVGELRLIAGSQHLYESNFKEAEPIIKNGLINPYPQTNSATEVIGRMSAEGIVSFLWECAKGKGALVNFGGSDEKAF